MKNANLQSDKKEWIRPILTEDNVEDKTENHTGAGNDGTCGSYGTAICPV